MNAVVAVLVTISFFRRYATKEDIKDLNDRLVGIESRQTSVETRLAAVETRLGNVETRLDRLDDGMLEIKRKADASLDLHHAVRGDLKVLQASVTRLESYFETPKLKSS